MWSIVATSRLTEQYVRAYCRGMAKASNRDRILSEGLRVVHERGFIGASVRDIIQAAGVSHGSFTNHFASKEAFCLEVLDIYFDAGRVVMQNTLLNRAIDPIARIAAYVEANIDDVAKFGFKNGCLIGNFSIETTEHSDVIRSRLVAIYDEIQAAIGAALDSAKASGQLAESTDTSVLAGFIVASLQGAILRSKVERQLQPLEQFKTVLFGMIMARPRAGDTASGGAMAVSKRASRSK